MAVFLATTSASLLVAVPGEARARELSIGGFALGGDNVDHPSPHDLHCDGIAGSTTTVDDSEQWYCYDEGVPENRDLASETPAETWLLQYASSFDAGAGTVACHTSTGLSLPGATSTYPWENDRFENLRLRATSPCPDGECGDVLVIPYWFEDGDDLALFTAEDSLATFFSGVGPAEEDLVIHLRQVSTPGVSVRPTRLQGDLAGSDSTSAQRRWPGFRELAVHVGADGVTLANAELYSYDSGFGPEGRNYETRERRENGKRSHRVQG